MQSTKEEEAINLISHGRFPVLSSLPVGGHVQLWMFVLYLHVLLPTHVPCVPLAKPAALSTDCVPLVCREKEAPGT